MTTPKRHSTRDWLALRESIMGNEVHMTTTGALTGVPGRVGPVGQLPTEWRERYGADVPTYTILSYSTPIAWRASDGRWVIPDTYYSQTTSCHQGRARVAISQLGEVLRGDVAVCDPPRSRRFRVTS